MSWTHWVQLERQTFTPITILQGELYLMQMWISPSSKSNVWLVSTEIIRMTYLPSKDNKTSKTVVECNLKCDSFHQPLPRLSPYLVHFTKWEKSTSLVTTQNLICSYPTCDLSTEIKSSGTDVHTGQEVKLNYRRGVRTCGPQSELRFGMIWNATEGLKPNRTRDCSGWIKMWNDLKYNRRVKT